jgi:hypothetical protein
MFSVELMLNQTSSWSEEIELFSSIAQLEIRGVIWEEKNVKSSTEKPCA